MEPVKTEERRSRLSPVTRDTALGDVLSVALAMAFVGLALDERPKRGER